MGDIAETFLGEIIGTPIGNSTNEDGLVKFTVSDEPGINLGETVFDEDIAGDKKDINGSFNEEKSANLRPGESVAGSYIVDSLLPKQGKQSSVYMTHKYGEKYVVKVYHNGWQPSERMKKFLSEVRSANIARVWDSGFINGSYYEVYEYYPKTLEDKTTPIDSRTLEKTIIPGLNEGLHALHERGIVHCDIKPSNLFLADDERVVIGDCGISEYVSRDGKMVDKLRGTPEYAPMVKSLVWSGSYSPAYDYGAMGLVLCRAILGRSLFAGMDVAEINRVWNEGIENYLPSDISGRLRLLVKGLLNSNEDERYGYKEVCQWLMGEAGTGSVLKRPVSRREQPRIRLAYGKFENGTLTVGNFHELANAIKAHWDQGRNVVRQNDLVRFIRQDNVDLSLKVKNLAIEARQKPDEAVFKLLLYLENDVEGIWYKGKHYPTFAKFLDSLSTGHDLIANELVTSGLLVFYLREKNYEPGKVDQIEMLSKRHNSGALVDIITICNALQGKKTLDVFDISVSNLEELIFAIHSRSMREIDNLLTDDRFIAWMNRMGYEKEMRIMAGVS